MSTIALETPEDGCEKRYVQAFMDANENIEIEIIPVASNDRDKEMIAMATAGNLPDMVPGGTSMAMQLDEMGYVSDLFEVLGKDFCDGFIDAERDLNVLDDGRLVCAPMFRSPTGLLYRADWLEELGLKVPTNWAEFAEVAKAMTRDIDGDGTIDKYGVALVATNNGSAQGRYNVMMATITGKDYDYLYKNPDGTFGTGINTPEGIRAMRNWTDLVTVHKVVPPGEMEVSYREAVAQMSSELCGMLITGPHSLGAIYAGNPDLKGKIYVTVCPSDNYTVTTTGGDSAILNVKSKNIKEMAEYMKYFLSEDCAIDFNAVTGRLPTTKAVMAKLSEDPVVSNLLNADITLYYAGTPAAFSGEVGNAVGEAYQSVLAGQATVEDACAAAEKKILQIIAEADS
jgi:ABC-type glycerol-3-phosphate transport system substrate-binding protein